MWWKKILMIFKGMGKFMLSFASISSTSILNEVGDIVYDIAERVEREYVGQDKFAIVKRAVVDELIERGIEYTTNILNTAIEMSVLILKDNGKEVKVADVLNKDVKTNLEGECTTCK